MTSDYEEISLCISCQEIYGIVLKHEPCSDYEHDVIEVLISDQIYYVHRTPSAIANEIPSFNIRIIEDEE